MEKKEGKNALLTKVDIKIVVLAISSVVFAFFAGCNRQDASVEKSPAAAKAPKAKKPKKPVAVVDSLAPTSVIVRVNGEAITKGDFTAWERTRTKVFAMAKGWKPDTKNEETKKFRLQNRGRALAELVKYALIAQYAREQGIEPDEKELLRQERMFLRIVKKPKAAFTNVVAALGAKEGEKVRMSVRGDALTMAVLSRSTSNDLYHVSAQEFTNRLEFVKNWNKRADESNAVIRARAVQAKKEIQGGAFFADVAKKYASFAPEYGEEWETFHLDEFDGDDPLGQWLARSDTGDISDPLDLDDGISIVGIKAKYVSDVSETNKPPVYAYDVVRCPFYAYERLDDYDGDRQAIEDDIIETRRQVAIRELGERLIAKAKFEYPYGENMFYPPEKKKKGKKGKPKAPAAKKVAAEAKAIPEAKSVPEKKAVPETKTEAEKKPEPEKKAN